MGKLDNAIKEAKDMRIDIIGLSEIRWTGSGQIQKEEHTINVFRRRQSHQRSRDHRGSIQTTESLIICHCGRCGDIRGETLTALGASVC